LLFFVFGLARERSKEEEKKHPLFWVS
jgi:hypothetical protein